MVTETVMENGERNSVLDAFIKRWSTQKRATFTGDMTYMWGMPLSVLASEVGDNIKELPRIFSLSAEEGKEEIVVRINTAHFPYLFRGTASKDDSDGACIRNTITTPDLIEAYIRNGHLTYGNSSDGGVLHTTKDPLVAFSGDRHGDFSSPRGSIIFIDKSAMSEIERTGEERPGIKEVVLKGKVPLSKVAKIYVHEDDARAILERHGSEESFGNSLQEILHAHRFTTREEFRQKGLVEVLELALPDKSVMVKPLYSSAEALERLVEAAQIGKEFVERLESWPSGTEIHYRVNCPKDSAQKTTLSSMLQVPSLPLPLYGNRKSLHSIDERIKQISSAVGSIQRRVPEAYEDFESHLTKVIETLEEAKTAIRTGEVKSKIVSIKSYLNWVTESVFPTRYQIAFDNRQLFVKLASALIKEINIIEQRSLRGGSGLKSPAKITSNGGNSGEVSEHEYLPCAAYSK